MLYCIFSPAKQYPFCFPNIFFTIEHADNEESIHQITLRKLLFLYMKIKTNEEMNIKNVHLESSLKCREFTAWKRVILHWRTKWKMNDSFILSRVGYWKLEAGYTQRFETWVQLFDTFERLLLPLGIGTKIV